MKINFRLHNYFQLLDFANWIWVKINILFFSTCPLYLFHTSTNNCCHLNHLSCGHPSQAKLKPKLFIPSAINTDYIIWHTKLILQKFSVQTWRLNLAQTKKCQIYLSYYSTWGIQLWLKPRSVREARRSNLLRSLSPVLNNNDATHPSLRPLFQEKFNSMPPPSLESIHNQKIRWN